MIDGMRFEFIVRSGAEAGRAVPLVSGQTLTIGRLKGCDIVVDDEAASRRHCTITAREDRCVVTDLQSANGTFVNERRIASSDLKPGESVRLGSTVIEMVTAAAEGARRPLPAPVSLDLTSEERGRTVIRREVDPTRLEFLTRIVKPDDPRLLLELTQRYLTTLHQVSEALSRASGVEGLFESILSSILDVTGGERAAILMPAEGGDVQVVASRTRGSAPAGPMVLSRTVVNDVLEKGISTFTDDAMADSRYGGGESIVRQKIRSVMCTPMRTAEAILGVLYVDSLSAREFSEAELELLAAVGNQGGVALHRARLMAEMEALLIGVMKAIAATIDAKDGYTHRHSERVAAFGVRLAREMGLDAGTLSVVELSGLLHDVGKIGVPDAILNKPGTLTDEEFAAVRQHPVHGAAILSKIESRKVVELLPGVKYHHERWDGKGYPEGLKGESIPLVGRVLAVADFIDALTSDRSYRKSVSLEVTVDMVRELENKAFDPGVVKAVLALHERGELALDHLESPPDLQPQALAVPESQ
jgi:HD-GYP domain-containing protein (c-di-GMP phosphodiesterase class II)